MPGQPWKGDAAALEAAYARAGLAHWSDMGSKTLNPGKAEHDAAVSSPDVREWQMPRPKLVVDCCVRDVAVVLPYGCDLGTAQRFTELWVKTFTEVLPQVPVLNS